MIIHNTSMKKFLPLAAVASLTIFGLGCNQTPAATTPVTGTNPTAPIVSDKPMNLLELKYDACQLVSKADAESILGGTVKDPLRNVSQTADGKTTVSDCTYSQPAAASADIKSIGTAGLLVRKAASQAEASQVFADAMAQSKNLSSVAPVKISGVGDQAYWAGGTLTQMNVLKGDAWYIINVRVPNGNEQAKALELAKLVMGKIK
ncbi:MAG: hypothetical protein WCK01_02270 [Candidatus Uhrbacteria bacterium]